MFFHRWRLSERRVPGVRPFVGRSQILRNQTFGRKNSSQEKDMVQKEEYWICWIKMISSMTRVARVTPPLSLKKSKFSWQKRARFKQTIVRQLPLNGQCGTDSLGSGFVENDSQKVFTNFMNYSQTAFTREDGLTGLHSLPCEGCGLRCPLLQQGTRAYTLFL